MSMPLVAEVAVTDASRSFGPMIAAMLALGALDIAGAALARSWAEHRSSFAMMGGILVFGLLFVVYGKSLDYAELSTVTIGWVVLLQVGVVVLDRMHGVTIAPDRMAVIALILVLQAYLAATDLHQQV